MSELEQAVRKIIDRRYESSLLNDVIALVAERERAARIDELNTFAGGVGPIIENETWKDWAWRVKDYLKARLATLTKEKTE